MERRPLLRWFSGRKSEPLDLEAFRARVAAAVIERHPGAMVETVEADGLQVRLPGAADDWQMSLARMYGRYREFPKDLDSFVRAFVEVVGSEGPAPTLRNLAVMVRPASYLPDADDRLWRPLAGDLRAFVAVDDAVVVYPPASDLRERLGVDDNALWERALANTRRGLPRIDPLEPNQGSLLISEGGCSSSALACSDVWEELDRRTSGGLLVLPAETNVVFVLAPFSSDAAEAIRAVANTAESSADYLSSVPLTWRSGAWALASEIDPAFAPESLKH